MLKDFDIKMLRLIVGTIFAPLFVLTSRCSFDLRRSIRYKVLFFVGGDNTYSIPTFFGGMIFVQNKFVTNDGVIYHELGHCRCWSAIGGRHGNVHEYYLPAKSELAADSYAVSHGYGEQLITALESVTSRLGHRDGAIRIMAIREQMA